ncbi:hypothetical protein [Variovorax sp. OV084]|jgi:hypothetical protein|uniref:hypothetical protein n=1 Tax=Variovorax sp. OV084 TaxID=1882777 RepID=UPI0008CF1B74|nr:hypothetical protein [Variovorax sp. OV084]SET78132.1 hypothetical protein SAMN05443580_106276 [Variovorax sp. OV084]
MSFTPNYTSDEELAFFGQPGVINRARQLSPAQIDHLARDLRQFRRAENGERARPDEINNSTMARSVANEYGLATPFAPRDTHRPDRTSDRQVMRHMREISQRIEDETTTYDLQKRMGTDADGPLPEPTLRDQIAAAANVHSTD